MDFVDDINSINVTSRDSGLNDLCYRNPQPTQNIPDEPGVDCWYAINGQASSDLPATVGPPFRSVALKKSNDPTGPGTNPHYLWMTTSMVPHSADMVMLYDGLIYNMFTCKAPAPGGANGGAVSGNANRLSARHYNKTKTNIVFMDGHAASFDTKSLPGGIHPADKAADYQLDNLNQKYPPPAPQWRVDQQQQ
jgi:prepilin-type processing-associated H-X9-DG protein